MTPARIVPLVLALAACASDGGAPLAAERLPYASEVVRFEPGEGAGFGEDDLPGVVLGPPEGKGREAGSLDVLALGIDGAVEVGFGASVIVDGDGPDFVVFENAFWPGGVAEAVYAELGEISVSQDGDTWFSFTCDTAGGGDGTFPGCAGWTPTLEYDPAVVVPLDPSLSGGDVFDLADVGLASVRFVRIRDVSGAGASPTAGFDLDAVGVVHARASRAP
jgi:hypothetical protein